MVRTMQIQSLLIGSPAVRTVLGSLCLVVMAMALTACSTTKKSGSSGAGGLVGGGRDGAPVDPPADLAQLPDPEPQIEPIRPKGPNKPYVVLGQAYEPIAADVVWKERGVASWYGTKFHGRKTASGELFSMYGLTAAHRTLPIPSYARVRNVANGKETIVRVNDRGPFHSNRVMDLSYAAAVKLGIHLMGRAEVEIERLTFEDIRTGAWRKGAASTVATAEGDVQPMQEVVSPLTDQTGSPPAVPQTEERSRAFTPAAQGFWIQLAALGRRESVERLQQRVASDASRLAPMLAVFKEGAMFKLQVGPYETRQQAQEAAQWAREALDVAPMVLERR